jgi:hypothetical protein
LITVLAASFILLHLNWPGLPIDAVTLALLVILILPWTAPLLESLEFPGGWKIKFQTVQAAAEKITKANPQPTPELEERAKGELQEPDPTLALLSLRVELEKRLRALARVHLIPEGWPLYSVVRELRKKGVLNTDTATGLQELVVAANHASHGRSVEPSVQSLVELQGPRILGVLDTMLAGARPE